MQAVSNKKPGENRSYVRWLSGARLQHGTSEAKSPVRL
jgi:hypothetical protein